MIPSLLSGFIREDTELRDIFDILGNEANSAKQYYKANVGEDEIKPKRNRGRKRREMIIQKYYCHWER